MKPRVCTIPCRDEITIYLEFELNKLERRWTDWDRIARFAKLFATEVAATLGLPELASEWTFEDLHLNKDPLSYYASDDAEIVLLDHFSSAQEFQDRIDESERHVQERLADFFLPSLVRMVVLNLKCTRAALLAARARPDLVPFVLEILANETSPNLPC